MKSSIAKPFVKSSQDETSVPEKSAEVFQRNVATNAYDFWPPSLARAGKIAKRLDVSHTPQKRDTELTCPTHVGGANLEKTFVEF